MQKSYDTGATRADTTNIPSRRGLLTGGTAALLAGAAIAAGARAAAAAAPGAAADNDAELIRLCDEFRAQHAVVQAWNDNLVTTEVGEAANDQWWDLIEAMTDTPAMTAAGLRAKAHCAILAFENSGGHDGMDEDLVLSTLDDVIALGAVA